MRPLCCGMRSHPYLIVSFHLSPMPSYICRLLSFPRLVLLSLLSLFYPNFCLCLYWVQLQLAPRNAVYERANCSDNGRASASINAVSRERFTPTAAADAVTLTYLRATAADFHPTYSRRMSMAVSSMLWLAAPPTRKECIVYRLYSMPAARIGRGGWWSSALPSAPRTLSFRLLKRLETIILTPWRLTIAWIPPPVGTPPWLRPRRFRGSLGSSPRVVILPSTTINTTKYYYCYDCCCCGNCYDCDQLLQLLVAAIVTTTIATSTATTARPVLYCRRFFSLACAGQELNGIKINQNRGAVGWTVGHVFLLLPSTRYII